MRWFRKPHARPTTIRRVDRLRPFLEQLEVREVPAALFLQGAAYLDANKDGTRPLEMWVFRAR